MRRGVMGTGILIGALMLSGCSGGENTGSSNVRAAADDDPKISAAFAKAKETLPFFLSRWKTMKSDGVSLKFALKNAKGGEEYIWFTPDKIANGEVIATCANKPEDVKGLMLGDTRTFKTSEIKDWMIMVGRKCYGGYTSRALIPPGEDPGVTFVDPE